MNVDSLDCVTHLRYEGRDIYLVGTAHVSQRSVAEVGAVISALTPDSVCVELDRVRHQALVDPKRWRNLDIFEVIRERRLSFLLSSLVLSSYQRRLGNKLGVRPGAEMLAAIEHAERVGARLILADRDIQATLRRTWAALSLWDSIQLVGTLIGALFAKGEITEAQVEALKDRDNVSELVREFAEMMPRLQRPLIDERDRYLMSSIREAPGRSVVAVVGAGHVSGMVRYLHTEVDRAALTELPRPRLSRRLFDWVLPLIGAGAVAGGYLGGHRAALPQMLWGLLALHGVCVVVFGSVVRAAPVTLLAAVAASPLFAFAPRNETGRLAAFVEALWRAPTLADREGLSHVASLQDWQQNRFTRVLLVAFGISVGSSLAAGLGTLWLLTRL